MSARFRVQWKRAWLKLRCRMRPLRIVLGSGGVPLKGWIPTDVHQLDILKMEDWQRYFRPGTVDVILAEHVWEHLTIEEGTRAAEHCFLFLRAGGRFRIAVPDGMHPDRAYVESVKPMGSGAGAETHKTLYTWLTLKQLLEKIGFQVIPLEYFDSEGRFNAASWNPADGMIRRSARFDPRNSDGVLRYTSVILDAIKPAAE